MATTEQLLDAVDEVVSDGVRRGMLHNHVEDAELDGRHVTIDGRRLVNFGSCSYLGLETHPALKAAVRDAVDRYGTQFSSSRVYASAPLYREAEAALAGLFGRPTILTPSTTLGHLAAMPALIGDRDVLLLDHQVHNSVQTAAKLVQAGGARVELLPHNDLRTLDRRLAQYRRTHRRVWYAADGLYSMYADFLPAAGLDDLAARHPHLWLYVDDAHAASWTGRHGRGYALEQLSPGTLARTVVALSLNKSFAAAGGALTFPDAAAHRRVSHVGGPLIFSGPVQPPMLGAVLASARLHATPEVAARQELLRSRIRLFNRLAADAGLPVVSASEAPIRCVGAGVTAVAYRLTELLRGSGFHVNTASFPAVPAKRSGARLTLTAHHTEDDVAGLVAALAEHLPRAIADEGATVEDLYRAFARQLGTRPALPPRGAPGPAPALRLERARSVDALDTAEWDRLLGATAFSGSAALRTQEAVFEAGGTGAAGQTEDAWDFHYWLVRGPSGRPVAATFGTTALWKEDMLSPAHVSAEVERLRVRDADPHFLTSPVLGLGSLLTQGDHLWLDRTADWRGALRLVLQAARAEEDAAGASGLVLRDLPDGDDELHEFLLGEGFFRVPLWDTWVRDLDFADDAGFLAQLDRKRRQHQRRHVLPWEERYRVEVVTGGSPAAAAVAPAQRDRLYAMYRAVHARALELNVFPLPRRVVDAVLDSPGWETVLLHLPEEPDGPVAFGTLLVTGDSVATVFLGLDDRFVASHRSYQQLLWQALRAGQRHGARQVLYGMSADLQKSRFGARRERRWGYVQAGETFGADVLAQIARSVVPG
ncbi:aminotransferase class I/II-fold pyridoxal phosphate-dependent enzyme [Geodermatophilus sp. DSM 44513]|uniref:aminotransferase class I/II-fold pyridoxal phosphate-dependent enzyme n=1 Tax=Geodermatophilus sp. DSM 44513 TaxID=1528104 RepID=UPI00126F863B|nr:aminotransferase class I/II-fold pyridoxal phosphate-dependent enzyme [Geodermatophilus sp. DSM 44513]WNV75005.1 aminotransferase class I/II-fold pyridoxal phosphate-dependent enzyme [Geodermatophilus sp. DSM 44513]